jgi:beta-glucosidase
VKAAFPFGHGLSYTKFTYSGLTASSSSVTVTVTNTGSVAGAEVAQLYLDFPATAGEPPLQLKGFEKVVLAPGAKQTVTFPLNGRSISIWDVQTHAWAHVPGQFGVMVGSSSEDIRSTGTFTVQTGVPHPFV